MSSPPSPRIHSPLDKLCIFLAVGFGAGWSPKAPGTFGTLVGLLLAVFVGTLRRADLVVAAIVILGVAGVLIADRAQRLLGRGKDPGCIVIDEIVAMPITFFMIPLGVWWVVVAGFALFRVFDISKLPPAKQLERLPGGLGVMADDWAAAVYSNLALHLLLWAIPSNWIV